MLKLFEKHFGVIATLGAFSGIMIGGFIHGELWTLLMKWCVVIILVSLLLMSLLKTDLKSIIKSFDRIGWILSLSIVKLIFLPVLIFFLSLLAPVEYRAGLILLAATPAAMATPGLLSALKGDINLGLVVSVITNLLAPFIIPFVLLYTLGAEVGFDVWSMFTFLALIVAIPFLLAFLLEMFTPKFVDKLQPKITGIIGIHMFFFNIAAVSPFARTILNNPKLALIALGAALILSLIFHLVAYLLTFRSNKKTILTAIIIMAYFNTGLAIVLANQYFDSTTLMLTVMYELIWSIGLIPLQRIFAKSEPPPYNAPA